MKTLNDYKDDAISALLDKYGAFFCFGNKQFEEKRKPGVKYADCGAGLLVPSEHAHTVIAGIIEIGDQAVEQDKQENGKEKIIERELFNFDGGKLIVNYEVDRLQIMFDTRPTREELDAWKDKGLRSYNWSPSAQAWQRKITANAMYEVRSSV